MNKLEGQISPENYINARLSQLKLERAQALEFAKSATDPVLKTNLEKDVDKITAEINKLDPDFIDEYVEDEAKRLNEEQLSNKNKN